MAIEGPPGKGLTEQQLAEESTHLGGWGAAPAGKESNWIPTIPGKSWFPILRLYGPLEPWFGGTWRLPAIQKEG